MSQSGPSPGKEPELAALTYCKDGPVPPKPAVVVLEIETYAVLHFRDSVLLESQAFVGATAQAVLMSWLVGIARYKPFQLIIGLGLTFSQVLATVRAGVLHWRVKPSAVVTWLMDILAGRADAGGDHDGSRPAFVKSHHADPDQGITKVTVAVFFDFTIHTPYTLEYESGLHRFLAAPDFLTAVLESQDTHTSPPDDGVLCVRQTATGAATTATAVPTVPAPPSSVVTSTIHQTTGVTAPSAMGAPSTSAPQRSSKVAKVPAGVLKDRLNVIAGEADVGDVVKAGVPVKKGTNDAVAEAFDFILPPMRDGFGPARHKDIAGGKPQYGRGAADKDKKPRPPLCKEDMENARLLGVSEAVAAGKAVETLLSPSAGFTLMIRYHNHLEKIDPKDHTPSAAGAASCPADVKNLVKKRTLDNYSRAYSKFTALNEEGQARARQASADKAAEWVRQFKEPFTAIAAHLDTNGDPTDGLEAHLHACLGGNAHLHAIGRRALLGYNKDKSWSGACRILVAGGVPIHALAYKLFISDAAAANNGGDDIGLGRQAGATTGDGNTGAPQEGATLGGGTTGAPPPAAFPGVRHVAQQPQAGATTGGGITGAPQAGATTGGGNTGAPPPAAGPGVRHVEQQPHAGATTGGGITGAPQAGATTGALQQPQSGATTGGGDTNEQLLRTRTATKETRIQALKMQALASAPAASAAGMTSDDLAKVNLLLTKAGKAETKKEKKDKEGGGGGGGKRRIKAAEEEEEETGEEEETEEEEEEETTAPSGRRPRRAAAAAAAGSKQAAGSKSAHKQAVVAGRKSARSSKAARIDGSG